MSTTQLTAAQQAELAQLDAEISNVRQDIDSLSTGLSRSLKMHTTHTTEMVPATPEAESVTPLSGTEDSIDTVSSPQAVLDLAKAVHGDSQLLQAYRRLEALAERNKKGLQRPSVILPKPLGQAWASVATQLGSFHSQYRQGQQKVAQAIAARPDAHAVSNMEDSLDMATPVLVDCNRCHKVLIRQAFSRHHQQCEASYQRELAVAEAKAQRQAAAAAAPAAPDQHTTTTTTTTTTAAATIATTASTTTPATTTSVVKAAIAPTTPGSKAVARTGAGVSSPSLKRPHSRTSKGSPLLAGIVMREGSAGASIDGTGPQGTPRASSKGSTPYSPKRPRLSDNNNNNNNNNTATTTTTTTLLAPGTSHGVIPRRAAPSPGVIPGGSSNSAQSQQLKFHPDGTPNLDRICGVPDPERSKEYRVCMRSLTCKYHNLSLKRNVGGRTRKFDDLLADHLAASRLKLKRSKDNKARGSPAPSNASLTSAALVSPHITLSPGPPAVVTGPATGDPHIGNGNGNGNGGGGGGEGGTMRKKRTASITVFDDDDDDEGDIDIAGDGGDNYVHLTTSTAGALNTARPLPTAAGGGTGGNGQVSGKGSGRSSSATKCKKKKKKNPSVALSGAMSSTSPFLPYNLTTGTGRQEMSLSPSSNPYALRPELPVQTSYARPLAVRHYTLRKTKYLTRSSDLINADPEEDTNHEVPPFNPALYPYTADDDHHPHQHGQQRGGSGQGSSRHPPPITTNPPGTQSGTLLSGGHTGGTAGKGKGKGKSKARPKRAGTGSTGGRKALAGNRKTASTPTPARAASGSSANPRSTTTTATTATSATVAGGPGGDAAAFKPLGRGGH